MSLRDLLFPDLILANGRILTMDAAGTQAEALAIKDGRVLATGSNAEIRELAGSATRTIDLQGRTALPGLTDAHLHLASDASYAHFVDVRDLFTDVRSIVDVVDRMRRRAAQTPAGEWVIARGSPLQEFRMAEQRRPNRHDLDAGMPDHPAYAFF